jgi:hypothetical protein
MLRIRLRLAPERIPTLDRLDIGAAVKGVALILSGQSLPSPGFAFTPAPSRHYTVKHPPRWRENEGLV